MRSKVLTMEELADRTAELRRAGKRIVFTNGCFDLLHVGHVRYLQAARALGDVLVVGVNGDQSVRMLKGANRPVNNERDRAEVLAALASVDLIAIFPEARATRLLEMVQPAVYAKGGDYSPETLNAEEQAVLKKIGAEVRLIPFEAGYSTTSLLEKLSSNRE